MIASYGLGSRLRILSIAHAKRESVDWQINHHCPSRFSEIFPNGIDGMTVTDKPGGVLASYSDYGVDGAVSSFKRVWNSLGMDQPKRHPLAVHYRGRWVITPTVPLGEFIEQVKSATKNVDGDIPIIADCDRAEMLNACARFIPMKSREIGHDLDRSSDQSIPYLRDLSLVVSAQTIITNAPLSTIGWLHRTFGLAFPVFDT